MRKTMKTMICTTAAVLMMSLAACGGSKTETTKAAETTAEAETTERFLQKQPRQGTQARPSQKESLLRLPSLQRLMQSRASYLL